MNNSEYISCFFGEYLDSQIANIGVYYKLNDNTLKRSALTLLEKRDLEI